MKVVLWDAQVLPGGELGTWSRDGKAAGGYALKLAATLGGQRGNGAKQSP